MASDTRSQRMPPPGKPKMAVKIDIAPGKGRMAPPGQDKQPGDGAESGGKHSAEEALVVRENQHCKDCKNWDPQTGSCEKVDGSFSPEDSCLRYMEPIGSEEEEPDEDDLGGPSDGDSDDLQPPPGQGE